MKIGIKNQFFIVVSILVVLAISIISVLMFSYINEATTEKMYVVLDDSIRECVDELENIVGDIQKINDSLSIDRRMFELVEYNGDDFIKQLDIISQFGVEYDKLSYLLLSNMPDANKSCFLMNADYPVSVRLPGINNAKIFSWEGTDLFRNSDPEAIWNRMDLSRMAVIPSAE